MLACGHRGWLMASKADPVGQPMLAWDISTDTGMGKVKTCRCCSLCCTGHEGHKMCM